MKVVIRQTIYNGYYGLLDKDNLDPHPVSNNSFAYKKIDLKIETFINI